MGFTDKYWMATLVADPGTGFDGFYQSFQRDGAHEFRSLMRLPVVTAAPGATVEATNRLFAGAKEFYTLRSYESTLGIHDLHWAIDWGWFYFLTKPIFQVLNWLHAHIGNMGVSIILLTFMIKALLFPLAYKSYVSMSKMKRLQPEMEKIKERCRRRPPEDAAGDDGALQAREGEPGGGLPADRAADPDLLLALQGAVRHHRDAARAISSAGSTTSRRPTRPRGSTCSASCPGTRRGRPARSPCVSIGFFPILMGITMWLQQKLNPPPADPTQKMIFTWMPWVFMFMLGRFAVGLVIYWITNNTITFIQQYVIMRSQGVDVDLLGNIKSTFRRRKKAERSNELAAGRDLPAPGQKPRRGGAGGGAADAGPAAALRPRLGDRACAPPAAGRSPWAPPGNWVNQTNVPAAGADRRLPSTRMRAA